MHPSGVWMEQSKLSECVCEATSHGDEYGVQQVGQVGTPNPKDIHILLSLFQPLHVLHHHHLKEAMNSILEDTNTSNWTTDASLPNEKQDHTLSSPNAQFHDADTSKMSQADQAKPMFPVHVCLSSMKMSFVGNILKHPVEIYNVWSVGCTNSIEAEWCKPTICNCRRVLRSSTCKPIWIPHKGFSTCSILFWDRHFSSFFRDVSG